MESEANAPAYPVAMPDVWSGPGSTLKVQYPGMTKRELIAMHVLAGLLSNPEEVNPIERMAQLAVRSADALLEALT